MRTSCLLLAAATMAFTSGCGGCSDKDGAIADALEVDVALAADAQVDAPPDAPPAFSADNDCVGASPTCTTAPTTFYAMADGYFTGSLAALDDTLYVSVYQSVNGQILSSEVEEIDLPTGTVVRALLSGKDAIVARAQGWVYAVTNDGAIVRFRRGAAVETLLTNRANLRAVIADNATLYWAEGNQVMRMPLQGGTPEVVMPCDNPWRLKVDATHLYCEEFSYDVVRAPKTASTTMPLGVAYAGGYPFVSLLQCGAQLYAVAIGSQSVYTVPTPDGPGVATTTLTEQVPRRITGLSASATDLYLTTSYGMYKVSRATGTYNRITLLDAESDSVVWNGQLFYFSRSTGILRCAD